MTLIKYLQLPSLSFSTGQMRCMILRHAHKSSEGFPDTIHSSDSSQLTHTNPIP